MKIYLIDSDISILDNLKYIIRDKNLGEICGSATNGMDALDDFSHIHPDIVILDLMIPELDGIALVKQAKKSLPDTAFLMLTQVNAKEIIAMAYESGIDFYIQKPINNVEIETIVKNLSASLTAQRTLCRIQNIFMEQSTISLPSPASDKSADKPHLIKLKAILQKLGIAGERGSKDIITLADYLIENQISLDDTTLTQLCSHFTENPKSMEQRVRRLANLGMSNLASLGLDDYYNETFTAYAGVLYNFEQVRREMDRIRGKSFKGGNVKIKFFLNSLINECHEP